MDNKIILEEMGRRIKERRLALGITQELLAEKMDVSIQMISNLELGKKAIRPENLVKLCNCLDISADYILRGKRTEAEISELAKKILSLSDNKQRITEALVDEFLNTEE